MKEQLLNEGKPEDKIEGILVGKVKKYYEEVCKICARINTCCIIDFSNN